MLQRGHDWKSVIGRKIMVIAAAIVALVAALIIVPSLTLRLGFLERHIGYATAAVAFLIVVIAVRQFKSIGRK